MNFFIVQHLNSQAWGCFFFWLFFHAQSTKIEISNAKWNADNKVFSKLLDVVIIMLINDKMNL